MSPFFHTKLAWLLIVPLVFILGMFTGRFAFISGPIEDLKIEPLPSDEDIPTPLSEESDLSGTTTDDTTIDSSTAGGSDDFDSCEEDLQNYCSGFYSVDWQTYATENAYTTASWKYGILDCLAANRDQTSQACDDSLDRRQALNDAMNTACQSDRRSYCAGIIPSPGSEPEVDCLKANYEKLSLDCAEALDAHEAAKPPKN